MSFSVIHQLSQFNSTTQQRKEETQQEGKVGHCPLSLVPSKSPRGQKGNKNNEGKGDKGDDGNFPDRGERQ